LAAYQPFREKQSVASCALRWEVCASPSLNQSPKRGATHPRNSALGGLNADMRVGRIRRQIKRTFIASGGQPLRISDLLPHCYPRLDAFKAWHRTNAHRAATKFAVKLERRGKGNLWVPSSALNI
jgi:hypothetical protein